jgi:hypothetical protein
MKLPLWVKDKEGKWKVFPYVDLLTTLPDGRLAISWLDVVHKDRAWEAYHVFNDKFHYEAGIDSYVLKERE